MVQDTLLQGSILPSSTPNNTHTLLLQPLEEDSNSTFLNQSMSGDPKVTAFDPNAAYPPGVNIGVPIFCILLFCLTLFLVYWFPSRAEDGQGICLWPEKGSKSKPKQLRRVRQNSQRLEEQEV